MRVRVDASIYMARVLQYLSEEILELAGNEVEKRIEDEAEDNGQRNEVENQTHPQKRIVPRDVFKAVNSDAEMSKVCGGATIAQGGIWPYILPELRHRKKKGKFVLNGPQGDEKYIKPALPLLR